MKRICGFILIGLCMVGRADARGVDAAKILNDLKQIGIAFHSYGNDNGDKAPSKPADLKPYLENNKRLLDMLENKDIVFIFNVRLADMTAGTSNTVLAYEKDAPTKGGAVLFGDASVRKMSADEFKKATLAKKK